MTITATTNDRSISVDLEVEILTDTDTLIPELVVDNDVVTADEARARITEAQRAIDAAHAVVAAYEGQDRPLCTKHAWCVEEDAGFGSAAEADTTHAGTTVTLPCPPHMEPNEEDPQRLLKLQLWATERTYATPRAYLAHDDGGEEISMDAGQLMVFAGQLDVFRQHVLAMAAQLGQAEAVTE